jgi:hypothetical protein
MARLGRIAAAVAAATTLNASSPSCPPPTSHGKPIGLSEMNVRTLFGMKSKARLAWYANQLGTYQSDVSASAACNHIPSQLLATVVLNELGDINWIDVWQQRLGASHSLGIAQIQVDTAKAHRLVENPGDKLPLSDATVGRRLTIPQFAIEAAAREIRRLLDHAVRNSSNPWPQRFAFNLKGVTQLRNPTDIYQHIAGATQREKEQNLAEMVVAAYNSPGILDAKKVASITPGAAGFIYANGTIHGGNSRLIAGELYDHNLFH